MDLQSPMLQVLQARVYRGKCMWTMIYPPYIALIRNSAYLTGPGILRNSSPEMKAAGENNTLGPQ
jgi:hypothetical protein